MSICTPSISSSIRWAEQESQPGLNCEVFRALPINDQIPREKTASIYWRLQLCNRCLSSPLRRANSDRARQTICNQVIADLGRVKNICNPTVRHQPMRTLRPLYKSQSTLVKRRSRSSALYKVHSFNIGLRIACLQFYHNVHKHG